MHWILWMMYGGLAITLVFILVLRLLGRGYAPGWRLRCLECGHTRAAASAGIIRVKFSTGSVNHVLRMRCGRCGETVGTVLEKGPVDSS